MAESRREIILDEIDRWRSEGLLDDEEYVFMRARYDQGRDAALDRPAEARTSAYVTHLVGGLLLGAAAIALVKFFVPVGVAQPLAALGLAVGCVGAAYLAERRRGALAAEAGFAVGLVAAASVPFYVVTLPLAGVLAASLAVGLVFLRRGQTPLTLVATLSFFLGAQGATRVDLFAGSNGAAEGLFVAALVVFGVILAAQRRSRWGAIALGAQGLLLTLAVFPVLDAIGVTDPGIAALSVGVVLGALFLVGLRLDTRPLVAIMSSALVFAAIAFAFLALGPALAAIVLLLLGAVLVWQAETVRGYFGATPRAPA